MTFWVCTILVMIGSVASDTDMDMLLENARSETLQSYPRHIHDTRYPFTTVEVIPSSISHVDETAKTFAFTGLIKCQWTDSLLKINISLEEPDQLRVSYSSEDIKTPVFATTNTAVGEVFVDFKDETMLADLNGTISVKKTVGVETLCDIDMTYFPFDEQICEVNIRGIIGDLKMSVSDDLLQSYAEIGGREWEVLSVKTGEKNVEQQLLFHLRRNSSCYLWSVIFPMILLSILNSFVFLLPSESREKISFLVCLLVTFAVFMNFVNDMIPKSDRFSRLALYLVLVQSHSALCILATLLILNIHHNQDREVPPPVLTIAAESFDKEVDMSRPKKPFCNVTNISRGFFIVFILLSGLMPVIFVF